LIYPNNSRACEGVAEYTPSPYGGCFAVVSLGVVDFVFVSFGELIYVFHMVVKPMQLRSPSGTIRQLREFEAIMLFSGRLCLPPATGILSTK